MATGGKSNFLKESFMNYILGWDIETPFSDEYEFRRPQYLWIALSLFSLDSTITGNSIVEPNSFSNYARVKIDNNPNFWGIPSENALAPGTRTNLKPVIFGPASQQPWGEIKGFALVDAETDGNVLFWGNLNQHKPIGIGQFALFAPGDIQIKESI
jgi:hypothetical protein